MSEKTIAATSLCDLALPRTFCYGKLAGSTLSCHRCHQWCLAVVVMATVTAEAATQRPSEGYGYSQTGTHYFCCRLGRESCRRDRNRDSWCSVLSLWMLFRRNMKSWFPLAVRDFLGCRRW